MLYKSSRYRKIKNKKIVVIGGGHGLANIARGLKELNDIELNFVVSVADDGGSTGRLRKLYNLPAMGDIRNIMVALSKEEDVLAKLMDYRFDSNGKELAGHNLGNIMITALSQISGSFHDSIINLSKILNLKGKVIPSTFEVAHLFAKMDDETIVKGESSIPSFNHKIKEIFYEQDIKASKEAIKVILEADLIIYGIGSLYTSIIPNTVIKDIQKALNKTKALKVYFSNCMTQNNETYQYDLKDHYDALIKHGAIIDLIVKHKEKIPENILRLYDLENCQEVLDRGNLPVEVLSYDLLSFKNNLIRHDSDKIRMVIKDLLERYVVCK